MAAGDVSPAARELGAEHELAVLDVEADLTTAEEAVVVMATVAGAAEREALLTEAAARVRTNVEAGPVVAVGHHGLRRLHRHAAACGQVGCQCGTAKCRERDAGQQEFLHSGCPPVG